SPVIGVILMVAITVILAAVIASFVLGLGQDAGQATPQISFNSDYDSANTALDITVASASDSVKASEISFSGDFDGDDLGDTWSGIDGDTDATATLTAGDTVTIGETDTVGSAYEINIVWDSGEGDTSVLRTVTGPDA
ncbi:MAG: type IV pilin N-terminal domain-containing protein, partial [Halapricum sp.]